jgi:hypothetical protein
MDYFWSNKAIRDFVGRAMFVGTVISEIVVGRLYGQEDRLNDRTQYRDSALIAPRLRVSDGRFKNAIISVAGGKGVGAGLTPTPLTSAKNRP